MAWSEWISRDPVTTTYTIASGRGLIRYDGGFASVSGPEDDPDSGTLHQYPQDELEAWECLWHHTRREWSFDLPDPYDGTCPTFSGMDYAGGGLSGVGVAWSAIINSGLGSGHDEGSLSMQVGAGMWIGNTDRLSNPFLDIQPGWLDFEFESSDEYSPVTDAVLNIAHASGGVDASYLVEYPDWTDPTYFGAGWRDDPSSPGRNALVKFISADAGPEGNPGTWDTLPNDDTVSVPMDLTAAAATQATYEASPGTPRFQFGSDSFSKRRGIAVIVHVIPTPMLSDTLPSFFGAPERLNYGDGVGAGEVTITVTTTFQPCRYRYLLADVDPPDPPGDPIYTTITGENGSARRSFYNARRRR